jgi:hypothetical protein
VVSGSNTPWVEREKRETLQLLTALMRQTTATMADILGVRLQSEAATALCPTNFQEALIKVSDVQPWLCQPDARQVFDLPESLITNPLKVPDLCHGRSQTCKTVEDVFGKSETCRASERQSRKTRQPTCF